MHQDGEFCAAQRSPALPSRWRVTSGTGGPWFGGHAPLRNCSSSDGLPSVSPLAGRYAVRHMCDMQTAGAVWHAAVFRCMKILLISEGFLGAGRRPALPGQSRAANEKGRRACAGRPFSVGNAGVRRVRSARQYLGRHRCTSCTAHSGRRCDGVGTRRSSRVARRWRPADAPARWRHHLG